MFSKALTGIRRIRRTPRRHRLYVFALILLGVFAFSFTYGYINAGKSHSSCTACGRLAGIKSLVAGGNYEAAESAADGGQGEAGGPGKPIWLHFESLSQHLHSATTDAATSDSAAVADDLTSVSADLATLSSDCASYS